MTDLRVSKITFTENTLKELMDLNANNPLEGSVDLAILYHEFTHAYFVLMKDNVEFRKVIQDGIAHYTGAILENGRQIEKDSASRAFSGTAAGYVPIHVFCWLLYVPYYKVLSAFTSHLSGQVIIPFEISRLP